MDEREWLARRFEEHRSHLRAVAYRMLGSLSEADDAVQEPWVRLSRSDTDHVGNLGGWLTRVVGRVCLDMLRSRKARREETLDTPWATRLPEPIVGHEDGIDPEHETLVADSVGLALLVVLETLSPAERLAFVLHDAFGVPFAEISPIVGRSPEAARQLASRARRRVRSGNAVPDADLATRREVVGAFPSRRARRRLRGAAGGARPGHRGAGRLGCGGRDRGDPRRAGRGRAGARLLAAWPDHEAGARQRRRRDCLHARREPFSVGGVTVRGGKIVAIDIIADPARLARLDLTILQD